MFRDGEVPNRKDVLRIVERSGVKQKGSSSRSVVGDAPSAGNGKRRGGRKPLGTLAKTAVIGENGGTKSFRKRTFKPGGKNNGEKKQYPPRRPKRTVDDEKAARLRKFALQNCAVSVLRGCRKPDGKPMFRVCSCMRGVIPIEKTVGVQYVPKVGSSHYNHLLVCASVWVCPVCSSRIAEKRRDELARLIKKHIKAGGSCYMVTYTIAHSRYDDLLQLLKKFRKARSKMTGSYRWCKKLKPMFGIVGSVSVLEVTWSYENGWHPHVHEIIFCEGADLDVAAYDQMARGAWELEASRQGLKMNKHGFKIDRTYGAVQDYITKFGCDPATDKPWGVECEVVRGHLKQGRTSAHFTPFALLAAIYDDNRDDLRPIFEEYARCFKGQKQLNYSPGLKDRYKEVEKDDDELLAECENETLTLVDLEKEQWKAVVGNDIRGELLEAARTGSPGVVVKFLADYGIEAVPAPIAGFRVQTPKGVGVVSIVTNCPILKRWRCSVLLEAAVDGKT